jgi:large subunit ribosomal protein L4
MEKVKVYNSKGDKVSELELNAAIFGVKVKPELVSQAVIAQQANARQVLAYTKDKGEVRGGGRKPWRQKKTGRARHGSIRSPLWRGGGITFGPTNERNFSQKINKKVKKQALLMTLSDKANNQKIILIDQLDLPEAKTKKVFEILQNLKLRAKKEKNNSTKKSEKESLKKGKVVNVLLVLPGKEKMIERAARNIPQLDLITAGSLNVLAVLKSKYLLMPTSSLTQIEKVYLK